MAALGRRGLLAAALAFPDAARAQAIPPTRLFNPTNEQIAGAFVTIAFGGDAEAGAPARTRLQRFRMPMRVGLLGEDAGSYAPWVARHLRLLSRLTGQPIEIAPFDRANVVLLLSADAQRFLRASGQRTLLARQFGGEAALDGFLAGIGPDYGGLLAPAYDPGRPHDIAGGLVLIPTGRDPALVWGGIVEELTQLLGLLGDDSRIAWSIFNDNSPYVDLTDQDCWLVRLLYDRAIRPGMTRPEALRAAQEAMRRLRPGGIIDGAGLPELTPGDAEVVEALLALAFPPGRGRLVRWDVPVRSQVITDAASAPYRAWADAQIGHLAFLTRHVIEAADRQAPTLFIVIARDPTATLAQPALRATLGAVFGPLEELDRSLARGTVPAAFRVTAFADAERTRPRAGIVVVRGDAPSPRIWAGLVAQTSAMLGQFAPVDALEASSFRTSLPYLDLTPLDQRVLRLLYLSAMRPGMTRAEARDAAQRAVGLSRIVP